VEMPDLVPSDLDEIASREWTVPKYLSKLTQLADLLANPCWAGGQQKGERCVMLFVKNYGVGAVLKIQTPPLKLSVTADNFDEAWAGLEASLRLPKIPWQRDENPLGQEKKKKR